MPFRILTVCTGNICRSAQAEQLLRAGFAAAHTADAGWELPLISSAGTMALVGEPMPEQAAALSREHGGEPDGHRGRQLTAELIGEADLVLALAREHRAAVARLLPRASRYVFTLREFARILAAAPAVPVGSPLTVTATATVTADQPIALVPSPPATADFPGWLAYAARNRGYHAGAADEDDVIDPYGCADEVYRVSIGQLTPAVATVVAALTRW
ncbi:MAG: low molecular weight phosphatase family protein [Microbacteriaceae bacterium]